MNAKKMLTTVLSLLIAAIFGYLTFRNTDFAEVKRALFSVSPAHLPLMAAIALGVLIARAWRWWYLFPQPRVSGEFWAASRALFLGYAVTNVASRLGELVRLLSIKETTRRDFGTIASTLALERILLDTGVFVFLLGFSLITFGELLPGTYSQSSRLLLVLGCITAAAFAAFLMLAIAPQRFINLFNRTPLKRFPRLHTKINGLMMQFSSGLAVLTGPRHYGQLFFMNVVVWGLPIIYLWYGMAIFGVQTSPIEAIGLFTVAMLGILVPSPGGLGTYHYALSMGLIHLKGVSEPAAVAIATYTHAVNYLVQMAAGGIAFFVKPQPSSASPPFENWGKAVE